MSKILACIDPRGNTDAVIDWAAWAAVRLAAPLEFLHVLERHPERAAATDFSGAIGVGAQASLLQALSDEDAQRSRSLREVGRVHADHHIERVIRGVQTPVLVAMAGVASTGARQQLKEALVRLRGAGLSAEAEWLPGEPQQVLPGLVRAQGPALLVMGAYGHSRLRQLLLGSTTSTLLRLSDVPVLILR